MAAPMYIEVGQLLEQASDGLAVGQLLKVRGAWALARCSIATRPSSLYLRAAPAPPPAPPPLPTAHSGIAAARSR